MIIRVNFVKDLSNLFNPYWNLSDCFSYLATRTHIIMNIQQWTCLDPSLLLFFNYTSTNSSYYSQQVNSWIYGPFVLYTIISKSMLNIPPLSVKVHCLVLIDVHSINVMQVFHMFMWFHVLWLWRSICCIRCFLFFTWITLLWELPDNDNMKNYTCLLLTVKIHNTRYVKRVNNCVLKHYTLYIYTMINFAAITYS